LVAVAVAVMAALALQRTGSQAETHVILINDKS
jgi:hypothetical protein